MTKQVAILLRGDHASPPASQPRLTPIIEAIGSVGFAVDVVAYHEACTDQLRADLVGYDAVLVWVDPVSGRADRTQLDAMLREVSNRGVWVSAHPDVISRMGTKQVLYDTRDLECGSDTYLYRTVEDFTRELPHRLRAGGARVLKQHRGNGGIGVQKVELVGSGSPGSAAVVRVQGARARDEVTRELPLVEFMRESARYFEYWDGGGFLIDQPFQPRIVDGIIRCYLVKNEVVGFARQYPPDPPRDISGRADRKVFGLPSQKTMFGRDDPAFAALRAKVEREWVPAMQAIVGVDHESIPVLWDADFLFGPKNASGQDTYVLCEINVSSVIPYPPEAPRAVARAVTRAIDVGA